jgi:hypothetical protein
MCHFGEVRPAAHAHHHPYVLPSVDFGFLTAGLNPSSYQYFLVAFLLVLLADADPLWVRSFGFSSNQESNLASLVLSDLFQGMNPRLLRPCWNFCASKSACVVAREAKSTTNPGARDFASKSTLLMLGSSL